MIDFGCGTGRFLRFFAPHCRSLIGTEITPEMLEKAATLGLPPNCRLALTDGIKIPADDNSMDLIWACAVLRYSLNIAEPVYDDIAREMYRVLKPGRSVVNVEMYVEQPKIDFTKGFEAAGFSTTKSAVLQRYGGWLERVAQNPRLPLCAAIAGAKLRAWFRTHFDHAHRDVAGLRDYFFVWTKPRAVG